MFFSSLTIISSIWFSNLLAPSFLPEDGFFSIPFSQIKEESINFSLADHLPLTGVSYHEKEINLSAPWLSPPPSRSNDKTPFASSSPASVWHEGSGKFLWSQKGEEKRSIASISKLMTALVFLDTKPDWEDYYRIKPEDKREGGKIYLFWGEEVKIKDLFYTSLVASANTATVALVSSTGLTEEEFVQKMNQKARDLRLKKTFFQDPTGLNSDNVSTAREIAKIAHKAFSCPEIRKALGMSQYKFLTREGRNKEVESTDKLLSSFSLPQTSFLGGKTGYNQEAGYCFVGGFDYKGELLISVVLGASEEEERFRLSEGLIEWATKSHNW